LVQFGYDGSRFAGWARQPVGRTVEGEIRERLVRLGFVKDPETLRLAVASRTDRGVSARANALVLTSSVEGPALLRILNGIAPEIFFRAATAVPSDFNVRKATRRWYRYYQEARPGALDPWRRNVLYLTGRLDARSFGRALPAEHPTWRNVEGWQVSQMGRWMIVDVWAPSFVWGMVRKMVETLRQLESGILEPSEVEAAVRGEARLSVPLAAPEPLVLWQVEYPHAWEHRTEGWNRRQNAYLAEEILQARVRSEVLQRVWSGRTSRRRPGNPTGSVDAKLREGVRGKRRMPKGARTARTGVVAAAAME
jgi:tRNA pseudouridine38-40 synthase